MQGQQLMTHTTKTANVNKKSFG